MDSITLYTEEIDDLNEGVEELISQTDGFEFKKNSMALIFVEEDTEYEELYDLLSKKWDFPIVGCTAMAMFTGSEGYCPMGISVMILSADDCEFAVGMTDELDRDNYKEEITRVYRQAESSLSSEVKLILSYGGMVTEERHVAGDEIVSMMNELGGGVPVYGGTASDGFSFARFKVLCGRESTHNGQAMVLIAGNIDPKFICVNSVENKAYFSYEITESNRNVVNRLGNATFVDTLRKEGMETDKTDVLGDYILSPFIVTLDKGSGDKIEVARNLSVLNLDTGAGSFLGVMPEGSVLSIGILNRDDVRLTVKQVFDRVRNELDEDKSRRTLICNSCCARFLALANNASAEADTYMGRLPDDVSFMGYYAYGEYCPMQGSKTGRLYNTFHNFTFTIMAI
jgi:hypothetical protein